MFSFTRPSDFVRRSLALTAILSASVAVAGAQSIATSPQVDSSNTPTLDLQTPTVDTGKVALFSSSADSNSTQDFLASNAAPETFTNAMQYGGGGRYGRPRYRGGNTTQDGTSKWAFLAGAGLTQPVTNDSNYLKDSWALQVGAGRNFNRHLSLIAQFDYDNFGLTGQTISNYASVYGDPTNTNGFDGHSHIWSFTLNPTFNFYAHEGLGAYFVVGGGFYHKEATFTVPAEGEGYDYYYGPYEYEVEVPVQNYTSNSVGANGGIGLTYKPSRFSGERLYAEVRIVHTFNQYKPASTISVDSNGNETVSGYNFFPQNSQDTTYFPVKFGIRF